MWRDTEGIIFDVGGVIEFPDRKIDRIDRRAIETINSLITDGRYDIRFLTNTIKSRKSFTEKLKRYLPISDRDVITASYATAECLKKLNAGSCWIMLEKYLFSWENVPRGDINRLLRFLVDDLDIDWAENAEIHKSEDGKTIRIFKDVNSAEIKIDEEKEKATLKISDGRSHGLKVKKENGKLNIYEEKGRDEFEAFNEDTENPEYIVIGDIDIDANRNREPMNKALRLLRRGAKLISMIPGLVDVSSGENTASLNVGTWAKILKIAPEEVPVVVDATYIGKPCPYVFKLTLKTMNPDVDVSNVVMVGDNVRADIEGAKNVGMKAILLRTREVNENCLKDLNREKQPYLTVDSIQKILDEFQD